MRGRLFKILFKFIMGGITAFKKVETNRELPAESSAIITSLLSAISSQDSAGVIRPFKHHFNSNLVPEAAKSSSAYVECLLAALNSICEEIGQVIPESVFETRVELADEGTDGKTYKGHIRWVVDSYSPDVYHICIDLLMDGFVYQADSKSFVITTQIA